MFKKYLLIPLLVVAAFLGMSSINTANAADDKQTIVSKAFTYARYTLKTTPEALAWAEDNTTGKAYVEPFRNTNPHKNSLLAYIHNFNDPSYSKLSLETIKIASDKAITIVKMVSTGHVSKGDYELIRKQKVWFTKVKGVWKISDYYLLMVQDKTGNTVDKTNSNQYFLGIKLYDSKGTQFPY